MKKMLWLLLAAMPIQAVANEEDPIAYKCYYCTPDEMEEVALAQGVGRHYVYDAERLNIVGYTVSVQDGHLMAHAFAAESWVKSQFLGMMALYDPSSGEMFTGILDVALLAPGSEHGRNSRYLWAQDLTSLNPRHHEARKTIRRFLGDQQNLNFLDTSVSGGKLLRFQYMLERKHTITAILFFSGRNSSATYEFDHGSRQWRHAAGYAPQQGGERRVQENREDFAPIEGTNSFAFHSDQKPYAEAFIERAAWAGIPVHGQLPTYGRMSFTCKRAANDIQCYID